MLQKKENQILTVSILDELRRVRIVCRLQFCYYVFGQVFIAIGYVGKYKEFRRNSVRMEPTSTETLRIIA